MIRTVRAILYSPIVQLVERWTVNPYVAGSSPARGAILKGFTAIAVDPFFIYFRAYALAYAYTVDDWSSGLAVKRTRKSLVA